MKNLKIDISFEWSYMIKKYCGYWHSKKNWSVNAYPIRISYFNK